MTKTHQRDANQLKRFLALSLILATGLITGSEQAHAEKTGNGGLGIFCVSDTIFHREKLIMLDLAEGSGYKLPGGNAKNYGLTIPEANDESSETYERMRSALFKVNIALNRLDPYPNLKSDLFLGISNIMTKLTLTPSDHIEPTDDYGTIHLGTLPGRCQMRQFARYTEETVEVGSTLYYSMDSTEEAALLLHEAIFKSFRKWKNGTNSELSRKLTASMLATNDFSDDVKQAFFELNKVINSAPTADQLQRESYILFNNRVLIGLTEKDWPASCHYKIGDLDGAFDFLKTDYHTTLTAMWDMRWVNDSYWFRFGSGFMEGTLFADDYDIEFIAGGLEITRGSTKVVFIPIVTPAGELRQSTAPTPNPSLSTNCKLSSTIEHPWFMHERYYTEFDKSLQEAFERLGYTLSTDADANFLIEAIRGRDKEYRNHFFTLTNLKDGKKFVSKAAQEPDVGFPVLGTFSDFSLYGLKSKNRYLKAISKLPRCENARN